MAESVIEAKELANKVRFSGDFSLPKFSAYDATEVRQLHYQDAVEISSSLTPLLAERLDRVRARLRLPKESIAAFIYSSPEVQASCVGAGISECVVRFSSAMLDLLSVEEFEFVIGHEIGHFLLEHQPIKVGQTDQAAFVQQRSQEISVDRIGLLACESLEVALRALMKTVSGLTEKHLRFDVSAFIGQLKKIEGMPPDWSGSTHPSIIIRAKALLWFSLISIKNGNSYSWSLREIATVDERVERDLQRFIDGAVKRKIEEARGEVLLWMSAFQTVQGDFSEADLAPRLSKLLNENVRTKLLLFINDLSESEREGVIFEKLRTAREQFEHLSPNTFESEMRNIQLEITRAFG